MQPYVYQHLPTKTAIRLLQICNGASGEELALSLTVVDLKDERTKNSYEALSYTWHDPLNLGHDPSSEPAFRVKCEEGFVTVTQNLRDALQQFQALGLFGPWWIDAVCIDQSNVPERSAQVSFMYELYNKARGVSVWLGVGNENSKAALRILSTADAGVPTMADLLRVYNDLMENRREYPPVSIEELETMSKFLDRRWFRRIWVVQEIYAADTLTVWCGKHTIPWNTIPHAALRVASARNPKPLLPELPCIEVIVTTNCILLLTSTYQSSRRCFHKALEKLSRFEATDPRDKIFALVGICSVNPTSEWAYFRAMSGSGGAKIEEDYRMKALENEGRVPLTPNYGSSVQSVFIMAAKIALMDAQDLSPLYWLDFSNHRTIADLPSWVPDYSNSYMVLNRHRSKSKMRGCANFVEALIGFDTRRENVLILDGALWDRVVDVTGSAEFSLALVDYEIPWVRPMLIFEILDLVQPRASSQSRLSYARKHAQGSNAYSACV